MTDAAAAVARPSRGVAIRRWVVTHRGLLVAEAIWILFAVNFNVGYLAGGDAQYAYAFVRRLFGSSVQAVGYQFGLALLEAPFYAIGRLVELAGVGTIGTHAAPEAVIAGGAVLYVASSLGFAYFLVRSLGLGCPALAASLVLFGSPLFYYGTFSPGQTHAVDVFLATLAVWLLYLGDKRGWPATVAISLGVVLGFAPTVRYFAAAFGVAIVVMLVAWQRWRPAVLITLSASVTLGVLLLIPPALGAHQFGGGFTPEHYVAFAPLSPLHMLFSARRGLFVWTPVTLLGVLGYIRLLRRGGRHSWFLWTVAAMSLALLAAQMTVSFWDAGGSFSQRYLTALFPALVIGLAGLLDWRPRFVTTLAVAGVIWSLFLCLTMQTVGFDVYHDTAFSLARRGRAQSVGAYAYGVWHISRLRRLMPFRPSGWR